ncbi:polysaccharide biosynthesis/export family protein [Methylocystis heyeri]|uniref:Polysaccharide export protein n=1 Tax=Methylocystis heyeri TaxID=391905 RepID=A0A6B8K8K1_9HYPH|nr:polysaccharide biosynthesis/export family protein [Methylocystis heyeri]QGM44239.1 polysaccharide export protein [Methylocystis heyeri]
MNIGRTVRALMCVFLLLTQAACDSLPFSSDVANDPPMPSQNAMKVQAGDKLKVTVFGEDKLTGEYEIDPGGSLSLPLAGTVQAAGLTKHELEQLLSKKLSSGNYLKDPKVTVDIATFRPFYVLGEVEKPGEYQFRSGLNVMSAIAVAGGATYRASHSRVMIQRAGQTEFVEYNQSPTVGIYPGDLIKVPERYF